MNLTYSKPYQWQDGDAWLVGRLVLAEDDCAITDEWGTFELDSCRGEEVLVQLSCDGGLRFVPFASLSPYPASPIEEPKGTT